jgi:hypothetical protein
MRARAALVVLLFVVARHAPAVATSGQSFLYVTSPSSACVNDGRGDPCPPSELLVYDTETLGLVTHIELPPGFVENTLVFSPDGRWLYGVGTNGDFIVDTDTNTRAPSQFSGSLGGSRRGTGAIRRDGMRLYVKAFNLFEFLRSIDLNTGAFSSFGTIGTSALGGMATNPVTDRLYLHATPFSSSAGLIEFDTTTEQEVRRITTTGGPIAVSADGTRIYTVALADGPNRIVALDAATLDQVGAFAGSANLLVAGAGGTRLYASGEVFRVFDTQSGQPAPIVEAPVDGVNNFVVTGDESRVFFGRTSETSRHFDGVVHVTYSNEVLVADAKTGQTIGTLRLPDSSHRIAGGMPVPQPDFVMGLATTPAGASRCSYRVGPTQNAFTTAGGTTTIVLTTRCAWRASSDAPWVHIGQTSGTGGTTITIGVDPADGGAPRAATLTIAGQLVTISQAGFGSTPPFGFLDTPVEGSAGHSGSLAVTGWALDDAGVTGVRIFRDPVSGEAPGAPVFIGAATMVDAARPDVAAAFPTQPLNTRAGWGLNVLTNMLPNQGNGTFRLYAYIDDVEGHTTVLGPRAFSSSNVNVTVPFGAIDTPGQGETVAGTIVNFGWALTPQPNLIPPDGTTIDVLIDGVVVGHPTYGQPRADIAALFPGYQNGTAAVGYFLIDTTRYDNGIHTIAWVVRDNAGNAAGIGSRYFRIQN